MNPTPAAYRHVKVHQAGRSLKLVSEEKIPYKEGSRISNIHDRAMSPID